jgi:hypothetical protein
MNKGLGLVTGIGIGAGLMYVLDPDRGNRRRAIMRDKLVSAFHKTGDALQVTSRDVSNRSRGLFAEVRSLFSSEDTPDGVLAERVRSKMGRVVSHPSAVDVTAIKGRVTLRGPILSSEVTPLMRCVSSVKGVEGINNQLEVHEHAGNIPSLQGGVERPGERFELMQDNWSPTARLLAGATGCALMAYCGTKRDPISLSLGTLGFAMFMRGMTNRELKRMVSIGRGSHDGVSQESTDAESPDQAMSATNAGEKQKAARQGNRS